MGCKKELIAPLMTSDPYSGITETGPDSPDPIGIYDPNDWKSPPSDSAGGLSLKVYPAYPNPTNGKFKFLFALPVDDSVIIYIDDWPNGKTIPILKNLLSAGLFEIEIDLNNGYENIQRKEGIVRLFFYARGKLSYSTFGDIEYK